MHLSTSTLTDEPLHHLNNHHHHQQQHLMAFADDILPGSGGQGGGGMGGGRPGIYTTSEVSCSSDYGSALWRRGNRQGILILVTFIIELLLLIFVIIMEYFLRWTDVFPLRRQNFTCSDDSISCRSRDKQLMADFAFEASVPDEAVFSLSFCVPAFVVLIGEIGLCTFSEGEQKNIRMCDRHCTVPYVVRRLLRFVGGFAFGAFAVMVISDVTKLMTGRLRPDFLDTCRVNETLCASLDDTPPILTDAACLNTNKIQLRYARTSFPSLNAALTSYSAVFISVYIHGAMRSHSVRVLRPFLALVFLLLSLLCGLAEFSTCVSHWTDVVVGFGLGITVAVYLSVCVLNQFHEHLSHAEMLNIMQAFIGDSFLPYEDKAHLFRPAEQQLSSVHIPRAHMPPAGPSTSSSSHPRAATPERKPSQRRSRSASAFQRDLSQSVDYHRRHQTYLYAGSSHM